MNREVLNKSLKFLLPLISSKGERWKEYTGEVVRDKISGPFVNAYSGDINKPWLSSHVFLVFDTNITNQIHEKLISKDSYTVNYQIRANGEFFNIYVFNLHWTSGESGENADVNLIRSGDYSFLSKAAKERIKSFWAASDDNAISLALEGRIKQKGVIDEIIPEMDDLELDLD